MNAFKPSGAEEPDIQHSKKETQHWTRWVSYLPDVYIPLENMLLHIKVQSVKDMIIW